VKHILKTFRNDETGAITVDWVVITAAVMFLAGAVAVGISNPTLILGESIQQSIETHIP
jgi:Flp pilus assembly pilin Flp